MIPEVIWTWRVGSSDPQTAPYGGYADQIIISPDQQHTIAQYPHAQGKIDAPGEAPIAQGSQPYMYQQPQQQYYTQPAMSQPYYNPHQGVSQPASQPPQFNVPYQQPVGQQPYIPQPFVPPQNN
ncbi:hypothetical protein BGZ76_002217 [Entomortierella beljakovae]|nr:hypothetical protein BGZ76_002217 [Entomortierella beljakovae]